MSKNITSMGSNDKILLRVIKKEWYTVILLIILGKRMNDNGAPCFNRIYFVLINSYTELACFYMFSEIYILLTLWNCEGEKQPIISEAAIATCS